MTQQNETIINGLKIFMDTDFEDFVDDETNTKQKAKYQRGTFSSSDSEEDDC